MMKCRNNGYWLTLRAAARITVCQQQILSVHLWYFSQPTDCHQWGHIRLRSGNYAGAKSVGPKEVLPIRGIALPSVGQNIPV